MNRLVTAIFVTGLGAALALPAMADPLVSNGTFANGFTGWTTSGTGTTPGTGIQDITLGGTNSDGYGDNIPDYMGISTAAFFVDDNAAEKLSQEVLLLPDTSYTLSFALYATQSGQDNPFPFSLTDSIGDDLLMTYTNQNNPDVTEVPVGTWTLETVTFTTGGTAGGVASDYNLLFDYTSGSTPAKDVALTDVAINAVPEPGTVGLLGFGLAALGLVGTRRRRRTA